MPFAARRGLRNREAPRDREAGPAGRRDHSGGGPPSLEGSIQRLIAAADRILVPAISAWEVAVLVERGRLEFDRPALTWIRQALALPRVELAPLTPEVAVRAAGLGGDFPGEPADRSIVATALEARAPLATMDDRVRRSGVVSVS